MKGFPEPGKDPECDAVREILERAAIDDPETLKMLLVEALIILRDKAGVEGIPLPFKVLAEHGSHLAPYFALAFAVNFEDRYVAMHVMHGESPGHLRAQLMEQQAADVTVIDTAHTEKQ